MTLGSISLADASLHIAAGGDGLDANHVTVASGTVDVVSGGGAGAALAADASAKGLKGTESVSITGADVVVDAADDALHSNAVITLADGALTLSSGDDAVHADSEVRVDGGPIDIVQSYEGIESGVIEIAGGEIDIVSSDDGLNVAGGSDSSGTTTARPGGRGGGQFALSEEYYVSVSGGSLTIDAGGDGFDSNGHATVTGGTVVVYGPEANNNGAIDVNGTFDISGGVFLAGGSAGMAEAPEVTSAQTYVAFTVNGSIAAGSTIQLLSSDGTEVVSYQSPKAVEAFVASTPDLVGGESYEVLVDGQSLGTITA